MTSFVRRVAGGLTVVEALWLFYAYFDKAALPVHCPVSGCPPVPFVPTYSYAVLALAASLLVIGGLGLWGASISYPVGAALSAAALVATAYAVAVVPRYGPGFFDTASNDAAIGLAFAIVALVANLDGMRSKSRLAEQANPMNLPVFG